MKDQRGKTIKVGDLVQYYLEDDTTTDEDMLIVRRIGNDPKELEEYKRNYGTKSEDFSIPYAVVKEAFTGKEMNALFFSSELRVPEPEDLI